MKKKIIFSLLLFGSGVMPGLLYGQTVQNVASMSRTIDGITISYSVGEMALISTQAQATCTITQGFLQPQLILLQDTKQEEGLPETDKLASKIKLYPNPTEAILHIETDVAQSNELYIRLYDVTGRLLQVKQKTQGQGINTHQLDMGAYASGTYQLLLVQKNEEGQEQKQTFNIQKTN